MVRWACSVLTPPLTNSGSISLPNTSRKHQATTHAVHGGVGLPCAWQPRQHWHPALLLTSFATRKNLPLTRLLRSVTAHTLVSLQELVQVLWGSPLTSYNIRFTIKQLGKSSTNTIPRKSPELELCFTGQKQLKRAGCSAMMPMLNTRGPSLATVHSWTPALPEITDCRLPSSSACFAKRWSLQILDSGAIFGFSHVPGIP